MSMSEIMERLRVELDARGIEWRDASEEHGDGYLYHMERTKFSARGHGFSCIWGYTEHPFGKMTGNTYGWPDSIECMTELIPGDPEPMSVEQVMAMVDGGDARSMRGVDDGRA